MPSKEVFKQQILAHMRNIGMTQTELSVLYLVSRQAVNGWFRTDKVGWDHLFDVAKTVGLTVKIDVS